MPFRAGQTFLFPLDDDNYQEHLWVIATEPNQDGVFAAVSFTSFKGAKDQTVVFRSGEHPFFKWDTCVSYALAEVTSVDALQKYLDGKTARMHADLDPERLKLVLDGFTASDRTKNRVREFIKAYKLAKAQSA